MQLFQFMSYNAVQKLRILIEDSALIKNESLNRDDPRFPLWHDKVKEAIVQNAPVKRFAFDEIPFASDFFLSKAIADRAVINDRIALVSDLKLAVELLEEIIVIAEQERIRNNLKSLRCQTHSFEKTPSEGNESSDLGWRKMFEKIELSGFSSREKDEVRETLKNLQNISHSSERDWDRFKRGIKFILDFDRSLALEVVPFLIEAFNLSNE